MKIIAFSDSHGNFQNLQKVVLENQDADLFLHLGDCVREFEDIKAVYDNFAFENISGNCDYDDFARAYKILMIKKKQIMITHGHNLCVKYGLENIKDIMTTQNIDIALFGHTHVPLIENWNGKFIINPGSVSLPRQPRREKTYAEIIIKNNQIFPSIKTIE
ncbi:MAG: YfcE family phosphodiesterase [Oscillospiraceae bacterium]